MIKCVKQTISESLQFFLSRVQCNDLPELTYTKVPFEGGLCNGRPRFFLGTKSGLLYFDGSKLCKIFGGRVYGITRYEGRWYTTWNHRMTLWGKPLGTMASVLSFRFRDGKVFDLRVEASPLSEEVHQIDAWDKHLYVTDTANNRILDYKIEQGGLQFVRAHYPNGPIKNGRKSANYSHINSIFKSDGHVYLMYHNLTEKTGQHSQIAVLNDGWEVVNIIDTSANSAHNVFLDRKGVAFCDSMNGRLIRSGQVLVNVDTYIRGLAVSSGFWLLGGSAHAKREERGFTDGRVYQYSPAAGEVLSLFKIPDCGSLYEIRLIDPVDLAISSSSSYDQKYEQFENDYSSKGGGYQQSR